MIYTLIFSSSDEVTTIDDANKDFESKFLFLEFLDDEAEKVDPLDIAFTLTLSPPNNDSSIFDVPPTFRYLDVLDICFIYKFKNFNFKNK